MWLSTFRTSVLTLAIGVFLQASGRSAQAQCEVAKPTSSGVRVEDDGSGGGMDEELCTELGGTFTSGVDCSLVTESCSACVIEGEANCQLADPNHLNLGIMSDLNVPPTGAVTADDFLPAGDALTQVCVWGTYIDASAPGETGPQGYEEYNCTPFVADENESFRIRVYSDSNGQPGSLVGESTSTGPNIYRVPVPSPAFEEDYGWRLHGYMLLLDTPISGMAPGDTYWLEVVSDRNVCPDGSCDRFGLCDGGYRDGEPCDEHDTCYWHWLQSYLENEGNDYHVVGTDDRPERGGLPGTGYVHVSGRHSDLAFCLGSSSGPLDFTPPGAPTGSCCDCQDVCTDDVTLVDCHEVFGGVWLRGWDCATSLNCDEFLDNCNDYPAIVVPESLLFFDTTCYTTDGPPATTEFNGLEKDIWFRYTATCTGTLVASMCMSGHIQGAYDSLIAVFHDDDHPYECLCPDDMRWRVAYNDENCSGISDGGGGIIEVDVKPGECWLIQVGGWGFSEADAAAGIGLLDLKCVESACIQLSPPEPDVLPLAGEPVNQKVRYLSFQVGEADAGREQAMRVTFVDLPAPFDSWNGTKMFVGPPEMYCENAGKRRPPCPPAEPAAEFRAATLQSSAGFRDWSTEGVVHVFHEGIVPGGVYHVQAVDKTCELDLDSSYSDPLIVQMSPWGDLVKDCSTCPCGPPDGVVGIPTDVTALLDKFRNLAPPSVPCPAVSKVRADLDWATPNQRVDISDVTFCLDAFRGFDYPFPAPPTPPCP